MTEHEGAIPGDIPHPIPQKPAASPRLAWLIDGLRAVGFLQPRWPRAEPGPWAVLAMVALTLVVSVGIQRTMMSGPLVFHWRAVGAGWFGMLLGAWGCWVVVWSRRRARPSLTELESDAPGQTSHDEFPRAGTLFTWAMVVGVAVSLPMALAHMAWLAVSPVSPRLAQWAGWAFFWVPTGWMLLAQAWLLGRQARGGVARALVVLAVGVAATQALWVQPRWFWYPDASATEAATESDAEAAELARFHLTQEVAEAQTGALLGALDAIEPQRAGTVDLYAITFAPYADEDVFSREVAMVDDVMHKRFDTGGRSILLQNHASTAASKPWATPLNLQRAIDRAAQRMDLNEDVLFLHLTSHGARDGRLSAGFFPLEVDEVTPQKLRQWLDAAGIRYSVISVSACFSGSWVAPLRAPGSLVMTAADAINTSYGCGKKSPLTFFGRAVYDEQLRTSTRSFQEAHAAARKIIDTREKEAGKTDGYSNPQIDVGTEIVPKLAELEARLAQTP
ncbi:MAG: hypothetical protein RLZZ618_2984 [Pseudomonadota bacterium]|jgi:hypothetical protein